MEIREDPLWATLGITGEFFEAKAAWLREQRSLHWQSAWFFGLAARCVSFARFDYVLSSPAFSQAVIGLERSLRLHYGSDEIPFRELFARAVREGVIHDTIFQGRQPLSKELLRLIGERPATYSETLSLLVPKLRNQSFHGTCLLFPDYIYLTIQMREIADVLNTARC